MDQSVANGNAASGSADVPLVVDLDGTLLRTDLFVECLIGWVAARPSRLALVAGRTPKARAELKARVAGDVDIAERAFPVRQDLLDHLHAESARGRRIYLATATDRKWAECIADRFAVFDGVFASDGETNLKGAAKADALVAAFGAGNFDYIGDSAADLAVWAVARRAIAVDASRRVRGRLAALQPGFDTLSPRPSPLRPLVKAMRVHQWAKNLLVFLPALAAHRFDLATLVALALTFVAFGLVASAVYVVNDLVDLQSDRDHRRKRARPFASGDLPVRTGLAMAPILFCAGLAIAASVSPMLLAVLAAYVAVTSAYSAWLKRKPIVDVAALAALYTVRLVAGGVAAGVILSPWLLGFSTFLFLSLALVKRLTELRSRLDEGRGDPLGRGYRLDDIPVLMSLASAAGYAAVVVLALYIESSDMRGLYHTPHGLWAAAGLLLFWISRVLLLAQRGEMHDDPIVFAFSDWTSRMTGGLVAIAVISSSIL
ncbi:MAG TPA: UbiA family prenyltransferase [Methylomirabilota bacterium]|nr:UbiA family prenyltransferase [Methylomirabilota bacterium]